LKLIDNPYKKEPVISTGSSGIPMAKKADSKEPKIRKLGLHKLTRSNQNNQKWSNQLATII
jgi:hypothetical protein